MSTLLNQICQLIRIESTAAKPASCHAALKLIAAQLQAAPKITYELFTSNGKSSLLAYAGTKRPDKFTILLNGHIDVVAGTPDQFKPTIKSGRLYGRGALDMKAAAVVMTDVFCQLAPSLPYPLGLQIVTDEEIGGADGTLYQLEKGVRAELVICGEFTPKAAICNESKGICWAQLTFTGKSAHGAYLWDGDNAVNQASRFVQAILKKYPVPAAEVWATTANVATFATPNTTLNRVPDQATVGLDIRFIPKDRHFASAKSAKALLAALAPTASVGITVFEPVHFAAATQPLVRRLAGAIAKTTGQPTTFIRKHGTSDARHYSAYDIPAVILGLQGEGLHGDNEYSQRSAINMYRQTLATFLTEVVDKH